MFQIKTMSDTVFFIRAYPNELFKHIAEHAVAHQKFGGPLFKPERMTWIKPNLLCYRYVCFWPELGARLK